MMERIARFMEFFWLAMGLLTAAWAGYVLAARGWEAGRSWLLFPAVCTAMWGYRRFTRHKMAQWAQWQRIDKEDDGK